MSQSNIVPRKSSPCCIGCVVLLIIVIGFSIALGIYGYRFAKKNVSLVSVGAKADPSLDISPDVLFPETVGEFERTSLLDTLENVPQLADLQTSGAHVAVYEDSLKNSVTVIAISTAQAHKQRETGSGILMVGRGKGNISDTGISIRDPFSGDVPRTIVTWSKPNWTFMVQTSSTLSSEFVKNFSPGGSETTTGSTVMIEEPVAVPVETAPSSGFTTAGVVGMTEVDDNLTTE